MFRSAHHCRRPCRCRVGTLGAALMVVCKNEFCGHRVRSPSAPTPVPVAIFYDNPHGATRPTGPGSMGATVPDRPYVTTVSSNQTRMIGDNSPPQTVNVGLYLPQHEKTGYYALDLTPVADTSVTVDAPFVTYDYSWESKGNPRPTGPPLPVRCHFRDGGNGWLIDVRVPKRHRPSATKADGSQAPLRGGARQDPHLDRRTRLLQGFRALAQEQRRTTNPVRQQRSPECIPDQVDRAYSNSCGMIGDDLFRQLSFVVGDGQRCRH